MPTSLADLLVCRSGSCAKKRKRDFDDLLERADDAGLCVRLVGCQGSCSGPTAVVAHADGEVRWYGDLRTKASRIELVDVAATGRSPGKKLRKRQLSPKRERKAESKLGSNRARLRRAS